MCLKFFFFHKHFYQQIFYFFLVDVFWFVVAFVLLITLVQSAASKPHRRRHQRSWSAIEQPKNILDASQWSNPCSYDEKPEKKKPNVSIHKYYALIIFYEVLPYNHIRKYINFFANFQFCLFLINRLMF